MSNIDSVIYVNSERNKEKLHGELSSRAVFVLLSYMDIPRGYALRFKMAVCSAKRLAPASANHSRRRE